MDIIFRPIQQWPGELTKGRKPSRFRAAYSNTLDLLEAELRHLKAKRIVIQLSLGEQDIRIDGLPRATARPSHPGVILSFDSKHGPLSYPCDTFLDWQCNLRAIALSLEHLRVVDRYGVTKRGEQYTGWQQLPPATTGEDSTKEYAAQVISEFCCASWRELLADPVALALAIKTAMKAAHPDCGGSHEAMIRVNKAREILALHVN